MTHHLIGAAHRRRSLRVESRVLGGLGAVLAVFAVLAMSGRLASDGGRSPEVVADNVLSPLFLLVSTALIARCSRQAGLDRRTRLAWRLLAVAFAAHLVADGIYGWIETVQLGSPFPSPADAGYLAFIPLTLAAVLAFPRPAATAGHRTRVALDLLTVLAAGFMLVWWAELGPALDAPASSAVQTALAVGYPLGDLVLLLSATGMVLRQAAPRTRRGQWLIAAALSCYVLADLGYGLQTWVSGSIGNGWPDVAWLAAAWVAGIGAHLQRRDAAAGDPAVAPTTLTASWIPYAAVAAGYGLLLAVAGDQAVYPLGGLVYAAFGLTSVVAARQFIALRENARLARDYHLQATTDALTGALNRRAVLDALDRELARFDRAGSPVALAIVDIDHFKRINDGYGHQTGDEVLCAVVDRCRQQLRRSDLVGRYGGDELLVLLPDTPEDGAPDLARRLVAGVGAGPQPTGAGPVAVTLSVGVAVVTWPAGRGPTAGSSPAALLARADAALYTAKRGGRDRACLAAAVDPAATLAS
jgi:diguanylate cyclase (GGDEF)-like protein